MAPKAIISFHFSEPVDLAIVATKLMCYIRTIVGTGHLPTFCDKAANNVNIQTCVSVTDEELEEVRGNIRKCCSVSVKPADEWPAGVELHPHYIFLSLVPFNEKTFEVSLWSMVDGEAATETQRWNRVISRESDEVFLKLWNLEEVGLYTPQELLNWLEKNVKERGEPVVVVNGTTSMDVLLEYCPDASKYFFSTINMDRELRRVRAKYHTNLHPVNLQRSEFLNHINVQTFYSNHLLMN